MKHVILKGNDLCRFSEASKRFEDADDAFLEIAVALAEDPDNEKLRRAAQAVLGLIIDGEIDEETLQTELQSAYEFKVLAEQQRS